MDESEGPRFPDAEDWPEGAMPERPKAPVRKIRADIPDEDDLPQPAAFSEDALAVEWVNKHGDGWRYVSAYDCWYQWNGASWRECETNLYFDLARHITRECLHWPGAADLNSGQKRKISSATTAANVVRIVRCDPKIAATRDQWNADPFMLATPAGVVDLKTGKLVASARDQFCSLSTTVAPAKGEHPLFDSVIGRVAKGDASMLAYLWRWLGYVLTGDVREEAFLFLHGLGGSGKGTLVNTVAGIMGDYARTIPIDALIEQKNPRHSQEFARLRSARFVHAGESTEGARLNEGLIKLLTGGDKWVAHRMRMDDEEFCPTQKFLIHSNSKPSLRDIGESMRRRIHLIEYPGSIPEEDRDLTLKERLKAEYPAILQTMIEGCIEWQITALGKPEQVQLDTDEYLRSNDTVGDWIADCVEQRDSSSSELTAAVYRSYLDWCKEQGIQYTIAQNRLTEKLEARGFHKKRTNTARYISGIYIKAKV